ncbi:hypothetical protein HHSLTHF2_11030 [Vreelandella venusta]|uniref:Uncharacterized protein n=1 Tax=Halomonas hydrothermalis TaxID=115561 RepID=A0A6F8U2R4_9GAMM|nr:hypothetical protein [Halomonas hydrothermalis]BCB07213.1 hypothetical protein HHSLTHF2_11030 [Halomonas hydrothermalis]
MTKEKNPRHEDAGAKYSFTIITARNPARLTKTMTFKEDGEIEKASGGQLLRGHAEVWTAESLNDFAEVLASLGHDQALTYGRPAADSVRIVTKKAYQRAGSPDNLVPRDNEHFQFPTSGGVFFIDYDPEDGTTSKGADEVYTALCAAVPGLQDKGHIRWLSSSSNIVNMVSGEDLTGERGRRFYFFTTNASDIPRAGAALITYLWAAGYGYIKVSKAGALLERTIVDGVVWQPERLDFAAGAYCVKPLEQQRGAPSVVGGPPLDTRRDIPDPPTEIVRLAEQNKAAAKAAIRPEAEAAKIRFIETRASEMEAQSGGNIEQHRQTVRRAVESGALVGAYPLTVQFAGKLQPVTVEGVIADPDTYNGCLTCDPLDDEYDNGRLVGKLYLKGTTPRLFTFRHNRTFTLVRDLVRVQIVTGRTADATERVLQELNSFPDVFDFGGGVVQVASGNVYRQDRASLRQLIGGRFQFYRTKTQPNGGTVEIALEPPNAILDAILSNGTQRQLKRLTAVISAPVMRLDGHLLTAEGYDPDTCLVLELAQ